MKIKILNDKNVKIVTSETYNTFFDKRDGKFLRWGRTKEENPQYGMPEHADIEITTICHGIRLPGDNGGNRQVCPYCYKSNTPNGKNMPFDTFKKVFDKLTKVPTLTQIAFGADAQATANPDIWKIMEYCRQNDVVPNITVADIDDETADNLVKYCGAVACSYYPDRNKDACYDSVKKLTDRGLNQVNIHCMVSDETYDNILQLFKDSKTDPRLAKLNAIVMLSLKKRGRGIGYHKLSLDKFKTLVDYAMENDVRIGFDSCSCYKFIAAVKDRPNFKELEQMSDSCESYMFSVYINVDGKTYPCSFSDGEKNWIDGKDVANCDDFLKDVWFAEKTNEWRNNLIKNQDSNKSRLCPLFEV